MFTGIIEALGQVESIEKERENIHFTISSDISNQLKIDQSVSHNGVCLTVVDKGDNWHKVTAIKETLLKTGLNQLEPGSYVNLERAMLSGGRLDGHIVQGHVDTTGICNAINDENGSWVFQFSFSPLPDSLIVNKGSICIDGVSLTVVDSTLDTFSVAIIPYTYQHTCFKYIKVGGRVNLEFDIVGKYLAKYFATISTALINA